MIPKFISLEHDNERTFSDISQLVSPKYGQKEEGLIRSQKLLTNKFKEQAPQNEQFKYIQIENMNDRQMAKSNTMQFSKTPTKHVVIWDQRQDDV